MTDRERRHNRQFQRAMEREARKQTMAQERTSRATDKVIRSIQTGAADENVFLRKYIAELERGLRSVGMPAHAIQNMRHFIATEHMQAGGGDYR